MDEEERKKKLQTGKEKLAAFRRRKAAKDDDTKKKKKKRKKLEEAGATGASGPQDTCQGKSSSPDDLSQSESQDFSTASNSSLDLTYDSDQLSTSAEELSEEGEDSVALDVARVELHQAKAQIHALEEKLYGKQAALEALSHECEQLKGQAHHHGDTQAEPNEVPEAAGGTTHKTSVAEYKEKLQEFQQAITQRDDIINQLSVNLQVTVQERDAVQQDAGRQAAQLTQQIHTLQLQLQQAGEMLKSQTGQQGVSVEHLLHTQQEVSNLQHRIQEQQQEVSNLQHRIQEQDRLLLEKDSIVQQTNAAMLEKTHLLEQKELALTALAHKATRQSEELQNLREDITSVDTVKQQMEVVKQQSSEEVLSLMQTVEELQKKLHGHESQEMGQVDARALEAQRAELEELHGQQILEMKETIKEQYQIQIEKLLLENKTLKHQEHTGMEELRQELATVTSRRNEVEQQWAEQNELVQSLSQEVSRLNAATQDSAAYLNVVTELKREYDSKMQHLDEVIKSSAAEIEELKRKEAESRLKADELLQQLHAVSEENVQLRSRDEETVAVLQNSQASKLPVVQEETDLEKKLQGELEELRGQLVAVKVELDDSQFEKESLQEAHRSEVTRLRSEMIYEHESKMKVFKENLEATLQQRVESIKAKKDREFVEQLQQARAELEEAHKKELEEQRKQYSIESLHIMEETAPEVSELVASLQQENKDLSEARDALLEQIDQSHHDLEEMQEELLKVANAKDGIIAENESLKRQLDFGGDLGENTSQKILKLERELQVQKETFSFAERNYQVNLEEMQAECSQLLQAKQDLEQSVDELQAAKLQATGSEFGPSGDDSPSTWTEHTEQSQVNSRLVQEVQDLKEQLKEHEVLVSQVDSLRQALDLERQNRVIIEEKAMNQMNAFELEKIALQDQIASLQQGTSPQETRQNGSDGGFDRVLKENQELRKAIQIEKEERENVNIMLSSLTQTVESLQTDLQSRETEQVELRKQLADAMREKEGAIQSREELIQQQKVPASATEDELVILQTSLAAKEAELEGLKQDLEILQAASSRYMDEGDSTEIESLGQLQSKNLLKELEQVKKELKETQDIYSKENKLLKEALEYERKQVDPAVSSPGQLQEEVVWREAREQELLQEKNQLVTLLKETTEQLQQEKETLQQQLRQQEDLVQTFQSRMQTSDSVSAEVQQVFGRQLSALQAQRDELLKQLETQKKQQGSFSDILLEKNVLEENLQKEKELLRAKLREKDELEQDLQEERQKLEQQIHEQRRLEAVLEEKNTLEQELAKQKRELEGELREIEERLHEKEAQLTAEKSLLAEEMRIKDVEIRKWQADLKEKQLEFRNREAQLKNQFSTQIQKVQSSTEENNIKRIQLLRVEIEGRHKDAIERLRRELDQDYVVRERRLRDGHTAAVSLLKKQHQQQLAEVQLQSEQSLQKLRQEMEDHRREQLQVVKTVHERDRERALDDLKAQYGRTLQAVREDLDVRHQNAFDLMQQKLSFVHEEELKKMAMEAEEKLQQDLEAQKIQCDQLHAGQVEILLAEARHEKARSLAELEASLVQAQQVELEQQAQQLEARWTAQVQQLENEHQHQLQEHTVAVEQTSKQLLDKLKKQLTEEHQASIKKVIEELDRTALDRLASLRQEMEARHQEEIKVKESDVLQEKEKLQQVKEEHQSAVEGLLRQQELLLEQTEVMRNKLVLEQQDELMKLHADIQTEYAELVQVRTELLQSQEQVTQRHQQDIQQLKEAHQTELSKLQKDSSNLEAKLHQTHLEEMEQMRAYFEKRCREQEEDFALEIAKVRKQKEEMAEADIEEDSAYRMPTSAYTLTSTTLLSDDSSPCPSPTSPVQPEVDLTQYRKEIEDQLEQHYKDLMERTRSDMSVAHQLEITRLEAEMEKKAETNLENLRIQLAENYKKDVEKLQREHLKELEEIKEKLSEEHRQETVRLRMDCALEAAKQSEQDMEELRKELEIQHQDDLKELQRRLEENFAAEMKSQQVKFEEELAKDRQIGLEQQRTEHEETLVKAQKHIEEEIVRINLEKNTELKAWKDKLQKEMEILEQEKESLLTEEKERCALKVKEVEELYKTKHEQVLAEAVVKHSIEVADLRTQLEDTQEKLKEGADALVFLKQQHQRETSDVKKTLMEEFDLLTAELKEQHRNDMDALIEEYQAKLARLEQEQEEAVTHSKDVQEKEILNIKMQHKAELENLKSDVSKDVVSQHMLNLEKVTKEMEENHNLEINNMTTQLTEKHAVEIAVLEEQIKERDTDQQRAITDLQTMHEAELSSLKQDHAIHVSSEIDKVREDLQVQHSQQLETARHEWEQKYTQDIQALQQELQELARSHDTEMEDLKQRFEEDMRNQLVTLGDEAEKQKEEKIGKLRGILQKDMETLKTELKTAEEQHEEDKARIKSRFKQQLDKMSNELDHKNSENQSLVQQLESVQNKCKELEEELHTVKDETSSAVQDTAERTKEMCERGFDEKLKDILNEANKEKDRLRGELQTEQLRREELKQEFDTAVADFSAEMEDLKREKEAQNRKVQEQDQLITEVQEEKSKMERRLEEQIAKYEMTMNRRERENEEGENLLKMLRSDLDQLQEERDAVQKANDHLLKTLSDVTQANMSLEERVSEQVERLTRDGQGQSGEQPSHSSEAGGGSFPPDTSSQSCDQTTDLSSLTDEGLDVSHQLADSMFVGPDLDQEGELAVHNTASRLQEAVTRLLDLLQATNQQLNESRAAHADMMTTSEQSWAEAQQMLADHHQLLEQLQAEKEARQVLQLELDQAIGISDGLKSENQTLQEQLHIQEKQQTEMAQEMEGMREQLEEMETDRKTLQEEQELLERQKLVLSEKVSSGELGFLQEIEHLKQEKQQLEEQLHAERQRSELQLHGLETALEEQNSRNQDLQDSSAGQLEELRKQVTALDKQIKSNKQFMEVQAHEREQEREEFQKEITELHAELHSKGVVRSTEERLTTEVQQLEEQLQEKTDAQSQSLLRLEQLERELQVQLDRNSTLEQQVKELEKKQEQQLQVEAQMNSHIKQVQKEQEKTQLASEEMAQDKQALQQQLYEHMLQLSALQAKLDDKKHGQEVADSWVAQLQEQLKVEREALNRKDREIENLVEQLEQFREDLVDKDEEIQRLNMEIQIQQREIRAQTDVDQQTAVILEENANLQSALKTLQERAEQDLSMPRYAQELLEEKNLEIDHLNEQIAQLRLTGAEMTSTPVQTEEAAVEDDMNLLEQKDEEISALRVELLNMRNRDPLLEPVVQHAMERTNQEWELAKAQLQEDIRSMEGQLRTQEREIDSLKQQLLEAQEAENELQKAAMMQQEGTGEQQERAAEEASAAALKERAAVDEAKTAAQQERAAAEQLKIVAEQEKAAAEQLKTAAQQDLSMAEETKNVAQKERIAAEEARAAVEQERAAAEQQKIEAQQERAAAEEARAAMEQERAAAEQERAAAEESRAAMEQERAAAQEARAAMEEERAAAEEERAAAQMERAAVEEARGEERAAAEQERVAAEQVKLSAQVRRLSDQELMEEQLSKRDEELRQLKQTLTHLQEQLKSTEKQLLSRSNEVTKLEGEVSSLQQLLSSEDVQLEDAVRWQDQSHEPGNDGDRSTDDRIAQLQEELMTQAQRHEEEVVLLKSSTQWEVEKAREELREEYRTRLENVRVSTQGRALKQKLDEIKSELTWQHQQHIRDIQDNAERDAQMRIEELELRHRAHIEELKCQYQRGQKEGFSPVQEHGRLSTDRPYRLDGQHAPGTETSSSSRASPSMYTPAGSELGHRLQDEIDATERLDNNLVNQLRQRQQGVGQDHSDSEVDDVVSTRLEGLLRRLHTEGSKVLSLSELQFIQQHSLTARPPVPDGAERDSLQQSLKQQAELLEYKLNQEKTIVADLQSSLLSERKRNAELAAAVEEERKLVCSLQNELSSGTSLSDSLRAALDREQTKVASVSALLESEKSHVKSLLEALEVERHAVQQLQDQVDAHRDQSLDQQQRDGLVIKEMKEALSSAQCKSAELSRTLEDQKLRIVGLQRELDKEREDQTETIQGKDRKLQELTVKLDRETTRANKVTAELQEQQKVAKQLQWSVEEEKRWRADMERRKQASVSELQSLLDAEKEHTLDLKTTLDRERQASASLRQSLTKERAKMSEELERERSLRNQLKNSLERLEKQSREAETSVQHERNSTAQLQAERDQLQARLTALTDREAVHDRQRQKDKQHLQQKDREIQQQQQQISSLQQQQQQITSLQQQQQQITSLQQQQQQITSLQQQQQQITSLQQQQAACVHPPAAGEGAGDQETRGVFELSHPSQEALTRQKQQLESFCQILQLQLLKLKEMLLSHSLSTPGDVPELNKIKEIQQAVQELSHELQLLQSASMSGTEPTPGPSVNEKILQQNTELTSFVARLSKEKADLRNALADLEEQVWLYRQKDSAANQTSVPGSREPQGPSWRQEKAELLHSLQEAQDEVVRLRSAGRQLAQELQPEPQQRDPSVDHVKMQHMYGRYLRAESFRKALVYQKKYLLLLLGGFQDCEEATLALIAKMGAYPSSDDIQRRSRHSKAFTRFRSAACVIIAVWRLQFLVQKWKRATRIGSPILNKSISHTKDGGQHSRSLSSKGGQHSRSLLPSDGQHSRNLLSSDGQPHSRLSPGSLYHSSSSPSHGDHHGNVAAAYQHPRSLSPSPTGSNLRFGITRYSPPRPHLASQPPHASDRSDDGALTDYIHRLESLQQRLGTGPTNGSRK